MNRYAIALLSAGLLGGVLAAPAARAQEGAVVKNLLGSMGLIPEDKDPIVYRERPPLVLPPKTTLREPVAPRSAAVDPNWPTDPDVAAKRKQRELDRRPVTESEVRRMAGDRPELARGELEQGRRAGAGLNDGRPVRRYGDNSRDEVWVHPDVLRATGRREEDNTLISSTEPERRALSEPPSGYRRSATGRAVQRDFEPINRDDEADPRAFQRKQQGR
ncbi:MAG TPA: hypothetical protein VIL65_08145 [Beijerinckiaceae bacterium]|jgi:hypothetical protein